MAILSGKAAFSLLLLLASANASRFQPQAGAQAPLGADVAASKKPLIDSEALQARIKVDNLLTRAEELYEIAKLGEEEYNHPTRVIGSNAVPDDADRGNSRLAGHLGTLSYIYAELAKLGDYYTLSNQSFPAVSGNVFESRLILGAHVSQSAAPMGLTPPTKDKEPVHGDLVYVEKDGCEAANYPASVKGNIALVRRGTCPFGTKSKLAGQAGAKAAVVYNFEDDGVSGTLGTPSPDHVATFGISGKEAEPILRDLKKGKTVDAIAYIDAEIKTIYTDNIIAQTVEGDQENCVMLGGHSDSVAAGPGINDDGSGSLTVLEVAKQLTHFRVNNCVRFAWWAGEEEGLLGSDYYVAQLTPGENRKIRLFMDYDMMGSPNFAYQIYDARNDVNPVGSQELRDLYVDWYKAHGLNYTFIPFDGRSDYDAFIKHGIPGGGIATGAEGIKTKQEQEMFGGVAGEWYDKNYHQIGDDVSNVNLTAWEVNTKLVAHSVATYALSFKGFPERRFAVNKAYTAGIKHHGHKLIV
ncbi:uncharacterized protein E0L32_003830 [Thyridium curvatum]|uniref:Peptide hydrolase n=1 Tax=Thyridium curvatum TaxID=1093900 RepID=A0A507BBC3_9PEZI|nr:uncharacterized protein E0L32_003830 [Thyridium curvatum]TPX16536.1 hypothetical protein E0L32_003830 [Thyridium curvatum]